MFEDKGSARSLYAEYIGENVLYELKLLEIGNENNDHDFVTFASVDDDDEEIDHFGCHLFTVKSGDTIVMVCDYANEFLEHKNKSAEEVVKDLGITVKMEDESEYWVEEDSYVACTTHATCQDSGTHYIIIQIK